eukprot:7009024-Pyramimonas_sp.AAC.1
MAIALMMIWMRSGVTARERSGLQARPKAGGGGGGTAEEGKTVLRQMGIPMILRSWCVHGARGN